MGRFSCGETRRPLAVRMKVHKTAAQRYDIFQLGLVKHVWKTQIIQKEEHWYKKSHKSSIHGSESQHLHWFKCANSKRMESEMALHVTSLTSTTLTGWCNSTVSTNLTFYFLTHFTSFGSWELVDFFLGRINSKENVLLRALCSKMWYCLTAYHANMIFVYLG